MVGGRLGRSSSPEHGLRAGRRTPDSGPSVSCSRSTEPVEHPIDVRGRPGRHTPRPRGSSPSPRSDRSRRCSRSRSAPRTSRSGRASLARASQPGCRSGAGRRSTARRSCSGRPRTRPRSPASSPLSFSFDVLAFEHVPATRTPSFAPATGASSSAAATTVPTITPDTYLISTLLPKLSTRRTAGCRADGRGDNGTLVVRPERAR